MLAVENSNDPHPMQPLSDYLKILLIPGSPTATIAQSFLMRLVGTALFSNGSC